MIPILMTVFAIGGTTFGMAEESLAFYVLVITVMIAAGYDALTGRARDPARLSASACYGSTVNPFATGIASGFADVSLTDGLGLRLVILILGSGRRASGSSSATPSGCASDPATSLVYDMKEANERHFTAATDSESGDDRAHRPAQAHSRRYSALAFVVMIYGVIPWEDLNIGLPTLWWWFPEMTASFLLFAILIGIVGEMNEGELHARPSSTAHATCVGVALIIGIARGITVIMNNGQITDTVLHWAEQALGDVGRGRVRDRDVHHVPPVVVPHPLVLGPRHRGDADHGAARRPSPVSIASLVVTAYQSASGVVNLVTPTSAVVMGGLAIARVPYGKYLRFVWPLLAILAGLTVVVLAVGALV